MTSHGDVSRFNKGVIPDKPVNGDFALFFERIVDLASD